MNSGMLDGLEFLINHVTLTPAVYICIYIYRMSHGTQSKLQKTTFYVKEGKISC